MRYFFHLHNSEDFRDDEGRDLPDVDTAIGAARRDAREMAAESVKQGHLNLSHSVEITDWEGRPIFRVEFGDVVAVTRE